MSGEPSISAASWSSAGGAPPRSGQYAPPPPPGQAVPPLQPPPASAVVPGGQGQEQAPAALAARGVSIASSLSGGADSSSQRHPHHHATGAVAGAAQLQARPPALDHASRAVSVPHQDRGPPPPPDAPPLTEDTERRLAQAEWLARTTARGGSATDNARAEVLAAEREAAASHEAGMLGMDPDYLADGVAEGRTVAEVVEEYRKSLAQAPSSASSSSTVTASAATNGGRGKKKPKRIAEWVLPKADGGDGSKKNRKSVTRMRIESALSSIGAF